MAYLSSLRVATAAGQLFSAAERSIPVASVPLAASEIPRWLRGYPVIPKHVGLFLARTWHLRSVCPGSMPGVRLRGSNVRKAPSSCPHHAEIRVSVTGRIHPLIDTWICHSKSTRDERPIFVVKRPSLRRYANVGNGWQSGNVLACIEQKSRHGRLPPDAVKGTRRSDAVNAFTTT